MVKYSARKTQGDCAVLSTPNVNAEDEGIQGRSGSEGSLQALSISNQGFRQASFFALLNRHPGVEAFNDGMALHFTVDQFLRLYPAVRRYAGPYLIIGDLTGGVVGVIIGSQLLKHPNRLPNAPMRITRGTTDGTTLLLFATNDVIETFLTLNPNQPYISNAKFWGELELFPIGLFISYATWNSLSPTAKERWFPRETRKRYCKTAIDFGLTFLFTSRVLQNSFTRLFHMPTELIYQLISIAPAAVIAAVQHHTRYGQSMITLINALTIANYLGRFVESLQHQYQEAVGEPSWLGWLRVGFWSALGLGTTLYTLAQVRHFFRRHQDNEPTLSQFRLPEDYAEEQAIRQPLRLHPTPEQPAGSFRRALTWTYNKVCGSSCRGKRTSHEGVGSEEATNEPLLAGNTDPVVMLPSDAVAGEDTGSKLK